MLPTLKDTCYFVAIVIDPQPAFEDASSTRPLDPG